ALRVAALRETFEESGVLLARDASGAPLTPARARAVAARHRAALCAGETDLATVLEQEDLRLTGDALAPFAHWITPEGLPRRFDTHFFLAEAPEAPGAGHDGGEAVDSAWLTPEEAERAADEGRRQVMFPTLMNLRKLGRHARVAAALAAA